MIIMKEVTKEEFYAYVNPRDICVSVENVHSYPYNSLFKTRNGELVGRVNSTNKNVAGNRIYPEIKTYYLV